MVKVISDNLSMNNLIIYTNKVCKMNDNWKPHLTVLPTGTIDTVTEFIWARHGVVGTRGAGFVRGNSGTSRAVMPWQKKER